MGTYYANVGPVRGSAMYRDTPPAAGVLESPDNPTPIGQAVESGWTEDGVALWRLMVRGVAVPGRWSIIDRQFIPQFSLARDQDRE